MDLKYRGDWAKLHRFQGTHFPEGSYQEKITLKSLTLPGLDRKVREQSKPNSQRILTNMRFSSALTLAAVTVLAAAPAFAGEVTGWKVTKPAASPCQVKVSRVYQVGDAGAVHAVITNLTSYHTIGKLLAATKSGTNMVMDGSDFSFSGKQNESLDLTVSKNPRGPLTGAGVMLSFSECTVAMH